MTNTANGASNDELSIWIDGVTYTDPADARVSAIDHGIVVGDGVFEALKVTPAGPFAVRRHLERLSRSAAALGLPEPDHAFLRAGIDATLAGRTWDEGKIRITYTGGAGPLGSGPASGPPLSIVAAEPRDVYEPVTAIVTAPWTRNTSGAMTGVKTTSYGENVRGLAFADERDATEAIFVNTDGHVCEGTGSNIFFVFGDQITTPPLSAGPLAGITRELLLEWLDVEETTLSYEQALRADEVFITSSLRDVQAVNNWDGHDLAAIGPRTAEAAKVFAENSQADLDP